MNAPAARLDAHMRLEAKNIEAEQALLGAIMMNGDVMDVIGNLAPEDFSENLHRIMFNVMRDLRKAGKPITPITIKPHLPADTTVGDLTIIQYLLRLTSDGVPLGYAGNYAQAIVDMAVARQAAELAGNLANELERKGPSVAASALLSEVSKQVDVMMDRVAAAAVETSPAEALYNVITGSPDKRSRDHIPFVLPELRAVMSDSGFEAKNLYGLLARSGEGKTSFTLQTIAHALDNGHPVLFLSYDQSEEQCVKQMAQQRCEVSSRRQGTRDVSESEANRLMDVYAWMKTKPFKIKCCTYEGVDVLASYAKAFVKKYGGQKCPMIVVDHIKAVSVDDKRADEGTKSQMVARPLKALAVRLNAVVILLNQRNSGGLRRFNPRPVASDLHGGEQARYDYDAILTLYRPWVWMQEQESTSDMSRQASDRFDKIFSGVTDETVEVSTIKSRFGPSGIRRTIRFEGEFTRFHSLQTREQEGFL